MICERWLGVQQMLLYEFSFIVVCRSQQYKIPSLNETTTKNKKKRQSQANAETVIFCAFL